MQRSVVAAASTCLAVGTLDATEGPTHVRLLSGGDAPVADCPKLLAFDGHLRIPSGVLSVSSVYGDEYLRRPAPDHVRIRLWLNDDTEPDHICVVIG
jgi:hypothetical protein